MDQLCHRLMSPLQPHVLIQQFCLAMSIFTGDPSYMLIAPENALSLRPIHQPATIFIDIAIANPLLLRGDVIHSNVPLQPFKDLAPALLSRLTIDGTRIIFPCSDAIDIRLLINLIDQIVIQHRTSGAFELDLSVLPQEPVRMVRLHVLLDLFGLRGLADELIERTWTVFGTCTLTLADVLWMWIALGPEGEMDARWVPAAGDVYKQMLAWGLLNGREEDRLSEDLEKFLIGMVRKGKPCFLRGLLERRSREYGLGPSRLLDRGNAQREWSDSAVERGGCGDGLTSKPSSGPLSQLPIPATVSSSVALACPYDECEIGNKVRVMAAQRDEFVRLRQLEAFGEVKDPKDIPPVFQEFGHPGWCESKGRPKNR